MLTKLDAAGNKSITYVPANGLVMPLQQKDGAGNQWVSWVHRDATGLQEGSGAYDPFGALITNVQPPSSGPPPNVPFYGATYGGASWNSFTDANNISTGCIVDGVRTDCNKLKDGLSHDLIDPHSVVMSTTGGYADFFNAGWGGLVMPTVNSSRRWISDKSQKSTEAPKLGSYHSGISTPADPFSPDPEWSGHWDYSSQFTFMLGSAFNPGPQQPVPQPAPTPPGLAPYKDIEQPCIDRIDDFRRDVNSITKTLSGNLIRTTNEGKRFPGAEINPLGQSFETAVNTLKRNGFSSNYSLDHPEGEGYQKRFSDGLWYHVIVKYPDDAEDVGFYFDPHPQSPTPRITVHCHGTNPNGLAHIMDTVLP